jgi:hypothetical protein
MAVIADGSPPVEVTDAVTDYVPSARPGSRAPHVWLRRGSEQLSTIDLFGQHFTLLAGRHGDAWREAVDQIELPRPPVIGFTIGKDFIDPDGHWHEAYGVETDGAVLVRPDGYVAWRSRSGSSKPAAILRVVFDGLLGRIRR